MEQILDLPIKVKNISQKHLQKLLYIRKKKLPNDLLSSFLVIPLGFEPRTTTLKV